MPLAKKGQGAQNPEMSNLFSRHALLLHWSILILHVCYIAGALAPQHTYPTASTGVAACHIGGTTLHQFAGTKGD